MLYFTCLPKFSLETVEVERIKNVYGGNSNTIISLMTKDSSISLLFTLFKGSKNWII